MSVAAARKLGLEVEVQLDDRVSDRPCEYHESGNPFLIKLMQAPIQNYPTGKDEADADDALEVRATQLRQAGKILTSSPYRPAINPMGHWAM